MSEQFDYPPEDPFISFGTLESEEQNGVVLALLEAAKDRPALIRELALALPGIVTPPKLVDENGLVRNSRRLTLIDRKSILYLTQFGDPKAGRTELAAIFGVSQQRISQIIGAHGGSKADADLLHQFRNTGPVDLRNQWRVEADVQRLSDHRAGLIAVNRLKPRHMMRDVNPVGCWSAHGYQFKIRERDGLYYFRIDAPQEDESNPRNSAKQALDDCFAICRQEAWANSSGSLKEWELSYKEDPTGPANSKNLARVGG